MGREAGVEAEVGGERGSVRVLLESTELILRGDIRRRYPRDQITDIRAEAERVRFACDGETVSLEFGPAAPAWAKAMATPPPSLRGKLGLATGARAWRMGPADDDALDEALSGALADDPAQAGMIVARVDGPAELDAALAVQATHPALPLWVVYPKGKGAAFGEGEIREALRAAGLRDTKSCAVSERLTATRFNRPKA